MLICELFPVGRRYDPLDDSRWPYLMGIELELENLRLPGAHGVNGAYNNYGDEINPPNWCRHSDASLRNGQEFVLAMPLSGENLQNAISDWYAMGYGFTASPRTSTHIHLNMSTTDIAVLRSMICLVYTIEDAIYTLSEEGRKWAGYSMPLSEMRTDRLRNVLNSPSDSVLRDAIVPRRNVERYYGFNFNIGRHGTVEFRYFPGGPAQQDLESWLDLITLIRKVSGKYSVAELDAIINSAEDLRDFLINEFGEWGERILSAHSVTHFYAKFVDVMALANDDANPERSVSVMLVNPTLTKFLYKNFAGDNEAAKSYLDTSLRNITALTHGDLQFFVTQAHTLRGGSDRVFFQQGSSWPDPEPEYPEDEDDDNFYPLSGEEEHPVEPPPARAADVYSSFSSLNMISQSDIDQATRELEEYERIARQRRQARPRTTTAANTRVAPSLGATLAEHAAYWFDATTGTSWPVADTPADVTQQVAQDLQNASSPNNPYRRGNP